MYAGGFSEYNVQLLYVRNPWTRLSIIITVSLTFDVHCCHMGTAIKHPVPDQTGLSRHL